MNPLFIAGWGAVSPAGWGTEALHRAVADPLPVPIVPLERPGWSRPLPARRVPALSPRPPQLNHPRLRRSSAISQWTLAAALEALANDPGPTPEPGNLGVIFCTTCGGISYSRRFYDEVLRDPALASPMLFPETVFNAPASHLAAVLNSASINYTLVGDSTVFLEGLFTAALWLSEGRVERCLVVAAEELDWLTADALRHFRKGLPLAEGAGALLLRNGPAHGALAEIERIAHPQPFHGGRNRSEALRSLVREMAIPPLPDLRQELLCIGGGERPRQAHADADAWDLWAGHRLEIKPALGEGLAAGAAWQCIAALHRLASSTQPSATVAVVGTHHEAGAIRFLACPGRAPTTGSL